MKKIAPSIIHACIKELDIEPKEFLALLLVAKKLYIRHGMQMTKKEYIEAIINVDEKLGTILSLLNELHCKKAEDIGILIKDMSRYEDFFMCSVDASNQINVEPIDEILWKTVHENNVFMSKTLHIPGLHITSNTHRYWRTIQDDMDKMLNN